MVVNLSLQLQAFLHAQRTMMVLHLYLAVCGGFDSSDSCLQIPITAAVSETMARWGCFALSISAVNSGFSYFSLNLALKNTLVIKFSFWHHPSREALSRRK